MANKKPQSKIQKLDFEGALAALQEIVNRMENNQQRLEDSISDYEEGSKLVALCQKKLDEAQLKVEQMVKTPTGRKFTTMAVDD